MYPIKVTIRDTEKSQVLENHLLNKASKLDHLCPRISSCRIVVDMPQKHKHQGKLFRVSIELNVQGHELVVNRKLDEDVYIAVAHAFDAIERKLEDYGRRRVNGIRKRKRDGGDGLGRMENRRSDDLFAKAANDRMFFEELDYSSDQEDVLRFISDENISLRE